MDREPTDVTPLGVEDLQVTGEVLSRADVARTLRRMAHELVERNARAEDLVIVGIQRGGVPFSVELATAIEEIAQVKVARGVLDVSFYRDDLARSGLAPAGHTELEVDLTDRVVVLVDDVLYTARTVRSALNALNDFGRPREVQLAVMVDRGHRELPIRADVVGKNVSTANEEVVVASLDGVWIGKRSGQ